METYRIETPTGTYRVESESPLTDEQAYQAAMAQAQSEERPPPQDPQPFRDWLTKGGILESGTGGIWNESPLRSEYPSAGEVVRGVGPLISGYAAPGGLLASLLTNFAGGVGTEGLARAVEGQEADPSAMAGAGASQAGLGVLLRPLGALFDVGASKVTPKVTDRLDLSKLKQVAQQIQSKAGLYPARSAAAAQTVDNMLTPNPTLPVNAPGLQSSAEEIRRALPYKQAGGRDMYAALREAAKQGSPEYDRMLQQYRSMHSMFGMPSWREFLGSLGLGAAGFGLTGPLGAAAVAAPRVAGGIKHAAPPRPEAQGTLSSWLGGLWGP